MDKKNILILTCILGLFLLVGAFQIINFVGYTSNENLSLQVPTTCYQEFANVSTTCGGLSTGLYKTDGQWENNILNENLENYLYDGNWSSSDTYNSTDYSNATIWINFTKPNNATDVIIRLEDTESFFNSMTVGINFTMSNYGCFSNITQIKATASFDDPLIEQNVFWSCYNGNKWINFRNSEYSGYGANVFGIAANWVYGYNNYRNISVYRYSNFTNSTINIAGIAINRTCQQEFVNVSVPCGALNGGTYTPDTHWTDGNYLFDGDYLTGGMLNFIGYDSASLYTVIKVNESATGATLRLRDTTYSSDLFYPIPQECIRYSTDNLISLKTNASWVSSSDVYWDCWNGTIYKRIRTGTGAAVGAGMPGVYGFAIIWNMTIYPSNLTLKTNNLQVWNYSGILNISNYSSDFSNVLNSALNNGKCDCSTCRLIGNNCSINFTIYSETPGILNYSLNLNYRTSAFINLTSPLNNSYSSNNKLFYCNISDLTTLSNATLYIWNSTGSVNNSLINIISGLNNYTSFNFTFNYTDTYKWNCLVYNNETYSNWADSNYTLNVDLSNPITTLNYPTNNQYINNGTNINLNCTVEVENPDSVFLYGNFTGNYQLNKTKSGIISGTINTFLLNLTDRSYSWTCAANKTTDVTLVYSQNGNYTFTIDTIKPIMNNMTIITTINSNQINFSTNITEINLGTCRYSIWTGSTPGTNITFNCNNDSTATAPGFGTYTLFVYAIDLAGNENLQNLSFTTSISTGSILIGGSSGSTPAKEEPSKDFSVLNTNLQNTLDISLAKDSIIPREKTIVLINRGKREITIDLSCDQTDVNKSSREIDVCAYVKFPNQTVKLSANEDNPTETTFQYYTPDYSKIGDNYYFNIIAKEKNSDYFSKLSVSSNVGILATIFYKWSYISEENNISYPVFLISLALGSFLLISTVWIFSKRNLIVTGLLLGLILFFLSIIFVPFII